MRSRLTTVLLVLGLVIFGAGGAYAASSHLGLAKGHHHGKKHHKTHHGSSHRRTAVTRPNTMQGDQGSNGQSSAQTQYGTRPGKGCGDRNHVHTGPPGNPSNTACPPQSKHEGSQTQSTTQSQETAGFGAGHGARHHTRHHSAKRHHGHGKNH